MKKYFIVAAILLLAVACDKQQPASQKGKIESIIIDPSTKTKESYWTVYTDEAVVKVVAKDVQNIEIKYAPAEKQFAEQSLGQATSLSSQQDLWVFTLPKYLVAASLWAEGIDFSGKVIKSERLADVRYAINKPIVYDNKEYGFQIVLPESWKGFIVLKKTWTGTPLEGSKYTTIVSGPQIHIRHPKWSQSNPYQDIPIMVFNRGQWGEIEKELLSVSAAPVAPSVQDINAKYVFALPPRYNYAYETGWEEVDQLLKLGSFSAYEPLGQKSENGLWTLVSGDPSDTCLTPTYKGNIKLKGWYVWDYAYVEKEWLFRVVGSDVPKLPLQDMGVESFYEKRPQFLLGKISPSLEAKLKASSADSPVEITAISFSQYCEGVAMIGVEE